MEVAKEPPRMMQLEKNAEFVTLAILYRNGSIYICGANGVRFGSHLVDICSGSTVVVARFNS